MDTQPYQLAQIVKQELRSRGIRIRDFAKKLKVSEPTLKRWLAGRGLLLMDWVRMLDELELSLVDAMTRIACSPVGQFEYTQKQEERLAATPGLLAFFQQLLEGRSVPQILEEQGLPRSAVSRFLRALDDLQLIRWKEGLEVQILVKGDPRWRKKGPLSKAFRAQAMQALILDHKDSDSLRIGVYRFSREDSVKLIELIDGVYDFARAADQRSKLLRNQSKSYGIAMAARPYEPTFLYKVSR
jgi:transcriptional regulator with XRE-family HTH domain